MAGVKKIWLNSILLSLAVLTLAATFSIVSQIGVDKLEMTWIKTNLRKSHRSWTFSPASAQMQLFSVLEAQVIRVLTILQQAHRLIETQYVLEVLWICRSLEGISSLQLAFLWRRYRKLYTHNQQEYSWLLLWNKQKEHVEVARLLSQQSWLSVSLALDLSHSLTFLPITCFRFWLPHRFAEYLKLFEFFLKLELFEQWLHPNPAYPWWLPFQLALLFLLLQHHQLRLVISLVQTLRLLIP